MGGEAAGLEGSPGVASDVADVNTAAEPASPQQMRAPAGDDRATLFLMTVLRFDTAALGPQAARLALGEVGWQQWEDAARRPKWPLAGGYGVVGALLKQRLVDVKALWALPGWRGDSPMVQQALWQVDKTGPSSDLHPFIRRLLGADAQFPDGNSQDGQPGPALAALAVQRQGAFRGFPSLVLSSGALSLLNGAFGKRGQGVCLTLGAAASRRLGAPAKVRLRAVLRTESVSLQLFGTGLALLTAELSCAPDAPGSDVAAHLQEVLHVLGHPRRELPGTAWAWRDGGTATGGGGEGTDTCRDPRSLWVDLLENCGLQAVVAARGFSYASLLWAQEQGWDALRDAGTRLACRYTTDYSLQDSEPAVVRFRPFGNVLHTMSGEGGSVVVAGTRNVEFLRGFNDRVRRVYLPLAMLADHERQVLLELSQEMVGFEVNRADDAEVVDRMRELHRRLVQFHLEYRFSVASLVTLHNEVHLAWRRALDLDRLLEQAALDVGEGEKILADQARRSAVRRSVVWDAVAASVGALIVGLQISSTVATHVVDSNPYGTMVQLLDPALDAGKRAALVQRYLDVEVLRNRWEQAGAVLSIVSGLAAGVLAWRMGRARERAS